ncbi:kinase [Rhodococcus rhodnii]|nr:kinase [Rhodococcus rhodnii]TXG91067.1 kinase [Rhodococcus rhodnii]
MTALLADPVSEVVAAAETLLTRRTGATVTLVDPIDLGGSGRSVVVRVRVAENPFSLPRTLVLKQFHPSRKAHDSAAFPAAPSTGSSAADDASPGGTSFLREIVSYRFTTALPVESRPGAELIAADPDDRLLVLSDLGDSTPFAELVRGADSDSVTNNLMAASQALGRMHAATVGREEDFSVLLRRAGLPAENDPTADHIDDAVAALPAMLATRLGVSVPDEVVDTVRENAEFFRSGGFRAFSSFDLCPDNVIIGAEGVRFLDYEAGGFRDAMFDIAYARMSFPGCLCRVDLPADRADAMADAWRAEVVGMWPALADDEFFAARIARAELVWAWWSTYLFLPGDDERVAAAGTHSLAAPRLDVLRQRWIQVARSAERAGDTALADHATSVAAVLA